MTRSRLDVAVVLPVRNSEGFIGLALESILSQTREVAEILVVNDRSTDCTAEILGRYRKWPVQVLEHEACLGPGRSLNTGLAKASSKYVAIMHADDISRRDRIEIQHDFLEKHPEIDIVGSAVRLIDSVGHVRGRRFLPIEPAELAGYATLSSPFRHSSVMMRRSALPDAPEVYGTSITEDYDLWARMLPRSLGANLSATLLDYRVHDQSLTSQHRVAQSRAHALAAQKYMSAVLCEPAQAIDLFETFAKAIVLRTHVTTSDLEAFVDMLISFNVSASRQFTRNADRARLASEQIYILSKIVMRSGNHQMLQKIGAILRLRSGVTMRKIAAPLFRDAKGALVRFQQ